MQCFNAVCHMVRCIAVYIHHYSFLFFFFLILRPSVSLIIPSELVSSVLFSLLENTMCRKRMQPRNEWVRVARCCCCCAHCTDSLLYFYTYSFCDMFHSICTIFVYVAYNSFFPLWFCWIVFRSLLELVLHCCVFRRYDLFLCLDFTCILNVCRFCLHYFVGNIFVHKILSICSHSFENFAECVCVCVYMFVCEYVSHSHHQYI